MRIDPIGLAEILGNCLDNAAKFTPEGAPIVLAVALTADTTTLEVRDGGPGIPADQRAAVLERFHRTAEARGLPGSGLGLSIVARAVAAANGDLELGSAPEGGLLVRVILPR
jgi:two-component system sensor histidine kinase MprB